MVVIMTHLTLKLMIYVTDHSIISDKQRVEKTRFEYIILKSSFILVLYNVKCSTCYSENNIFLKSIENGGNNTI